MTHLSPSKDKFTPGWTAAKPTALLNADFFMYHHLFVCFHGIIYPVLCLELCFYTCVYRFTFYPPICRSSMKSRASVFTSGWSYWEHCIDINWYSIRPLMNMGTFLTLTAVQWHLSEQEKNSTSTNTSHIGSMSISAGDAPI